MDNGCKKCAKMPNDELCPECEIAYLEWDIMRNMDRIEILSKIIEKEKENEHATI